MRIYPALIVRSSAGSDDFGELLAAVLDDFGVVAIDDVEEGGVRAFFSQVEQRDAAKADVSKRFPAATVETADISDENWAERSQASLKAVRVGDLVVAPPWDTPQNAAHTIVIVPSMGFGTGHHATTRLCLMALQTAKLAGKSVVDVGTGSGVLALAAAKLGASYVLGFDDDPDAIANARENMSLNGLGVDFRCRGLGDLPLLEAPFDVAVANLTGGMFIRWARRLERLVAPAGQLILSGLREEEETDVAAAFDRHVNARASEDGWVCLALG